MPRCACFLVLFALTCASALGSARKAAPAAPPAPAAQPQASPNSVSTIKAKAQLVIVDVVVTDSKQNPIRGLKPSDFTLTEDGTSQSISGFEEHVPSSQQVTNIPPMKLPPGIFTNFMLFPPDGPVNVLLLDALNTQMKDQAYVREQLLDFLKKTPAGTRMAIFGLNDRLVMLQGFTSDLNLLRTVVEKSRPNSSLKLPDNVGNGGVAMPSQVMSDVTAGAGDVAQLVASVQQFEAVQASADTQIRSQQTLDALSEIAHFLGGIPGRKNLIWFSGSFPVTIFPDQSVQHPFLVVASSDQATRETADLLTRSRVAVYPIDARGLQTSATSIGTDPSLASMSNSGLIQTSEKLFQDNTSDHLTMTRLAADTGGQAYVDANNLTSAVEKAIDNGSNYYTLSYVPTNSAEDSRFRKIQVKVAQRGLNLSYRSGYFANSPATVTPSLADLGSPKLTGDNSFTRTMLRGAPEATEILLKLQVVPASNSPETTVVKGNILSTAAAARAMTKGPYRRYAIDIAADARDIRITPTHDGHYQFAVEVLTFVYDTNGILINTAVQKAQGNLSASTYANMNHVGLPFHQEISVPVNGQYYLRTSVHDMDTDRSGSVEIPVASVASLAPLAAAANSARAAPR